MTPDYLWSERRGEEDYTPGIAARIHEMYPVRGHPGAIADFFGPENARLFSLLGRLAPSWQVG